MRNSCRTLVVVTTLSLLANAASAATVEFVGLGFADVVHLNYNGNDMTVYAGQIRIRIDSGPIESAYCVDLNTTITNNWIATLGSPAALNGGRQIAYLFDTYAATVDTNAEAAGLQIAIWEVLTDFAAVNLGGGNFRVASNQPGYNEALTFLTGLPSNYTDFPPPYVLFNSHDTISQDLIVPEPATMAFIGPVLIALFRRKPRA